MFFSSSISVLLVALSSTVQAQNPILAIHNYKNTTIAGVTVIDTPIVRLAREYGRNHSTDAVWAHQMRSWIFGAAIIQNNATLAATVDIEVQAVSAILHDLGWDMSADSPITTLDHRFEVDGAIAARAFLAKYGDHTWDARRTQLVWDAIALHTTRSIGYFKEPEVYITSAGIGSDYNAAAPGVSNATYGAITTVFPQTELKKATNDTFTWFCQIKPVQTYGMYLCTVVHDFPMLTRM